LKLSRYGFEIQKGEEKKEMINILTYQRRGYFAANLKNFFRYGEFFA
jgi:hypothetical protein